MKTRKGFVSNSSSSSFIIGAAKVLDKAWVEALLDRHDDCKIFTRKGLEAHALYHKDWDLELWKDHLIIRAHTNDEEDCWVTLHEGDDCFLVVNIGHDEEDGPFIRDNFYGLDYSIVNERYFEKNFPDSYDLLELLKGKEGLTEPLAYRYGVSRNG